MLRILVTILSAIMLASCSPVVPTSTPTPLIPTPTLTATPPPIPTLNSKVDLRLQPNRGYTIMIYFMDPEPAILRIYEPSPSDNVVEFRFDAQAEDVEHSLDESGTEWGLPYVMYALNMQPLHNTPASTSIQASLVRSPDEQSLAFELCNEYGGRGQWCGESRLWLFNLASGTAQVIELRDVRALYMMKMRFSEDGQTLYSDACVKNANPYFGHCGQRVAMTWDVASGRLLDQSAPTPMNTDLTY